MPRGIDTGRQIESRFQTRTALSDVQTSLADSTILTALHHAVRSALAEDIDGTGAVGPDVQSPVRRITIHKYSLTRLLNHDPEFNLICPQIRRVGPDLQVAEAVGGDDVIIGVER